MDTPVTTIDPKPPQSSAEIIKEAAVTTIVAGLIEVVVDKVLG